MNQAKKSKQDCTFRFFSNSVHISSTVRKRWGKERSTMGISLFPLNRSAISASTCPLPFLVKGDGGHAIHHLGWPSNCPKVFRTHKPSCLAILFIQNFVFFHYYCLFV